MPTKPTSIWNIKETLMGATTTGLYWSGSNGNEGLAPHSLKHQD